MAVVLERRASKDEILELYLNEVYLGQRGSFAIHGVAEGGAAVLRQGRDQPDARRGRDDRRRHPVAVQPLAVHVRHAAHASAATSCCRRWRRPASSPARRPNAASAEPLTVVPARARRRGAVLRRHRRPGARRAVSRRSPRSAQRIDVYTTLDLHLQRLAQDAVRDGLLARRPAAVAPQAQADAAAAGGAPRDRSAHRRDPRVGRRPLVQPVAVQPRR